MTRHRRWIGATLSLLAVVSACSFSQEHGYVQSADGSLSLRYPADWHDADLQPQGSEWVAGIDASATGDTDPDEVLPDEPFVKVQVFPLRAQPRDEITLRSLRLFALPDQRDPVSSTDDDLNVLFHRSVVNDHGFEGHHMRFEIDLGDRTAVQEHLAVFDPTRERIQRVSIICTEACFTANSAEIEEIFQSVRLQP